MSQSTPTYPLLGAIQSPTDLRNLPESELPSLAAELREFLINSLGTRDAPFAAALGTVELTLALHYVFNTPEDRLVWDVGHQAYPHKVLTGRRDRLQSRGCDAFGVRHSSTSISAALGMAIAAAREATGRRAVAIIGERAMSAGMAFEALNHAGSLPVDLLVVLNDNDMSISENVGALSNYLARVISGRLYAQLREGGKKALRQMPVMRELARRSEEHVKGMLLPGTLFMEMGFNYVGPIDGHDLKALLRALRNVRLAHGPQLLHVVTGAGKGCAPAEAGLILRREPAPEKPATPSYSEVFGQWLCDLAATDPRIIAITPALRDGSGLTPFSQRFPERYFDVAIAEQHAVTFAAGLAVGGLRPVLAIYSTFLQRGYDQLIHDVALQQLPVLFAIDRAGLAGSDSATHHGRYDLCFLRCIPNMVVMAPADENECRQMLYTATRLDGPAAVRYPRGHGPGAAIAQQMTALKIGRAEIRRHGEGGLALLSFGVMLAPALWLGERFDATVVNMRFVKPLDLELLREIAGTHAAIVTLEDNVIAGGAGSACAEALAAEALTVPHLHIGITDRITEPGSRDESLAAAGLDRAGMAAAIEHWRAGVPGLKSSRSATKLAAARTP